MQTSTRPSQSIGLASWLGGGSVLVVFVAVTAMAIACALLLGRLVEEQASTRAQLAGSAARELLRRVGEDTLSDARVLADRPTLQRMLGSGEVAGLEFFLRRFCESARADVCGVLENDTVVASVGPNVTWPDVSTAITEQGERFLIAPRDGSAPIWGAAVTMPDSRTLRAVALSIADQRLLNDLSRQVGATVTLVNFATYTGTESSPFTPLHNVALANGREAVAELDDGKAFGSSVVVSSSTGEVIALLDARVDGAEFAGSVRNFIRTLAIAALLVAAIAGLAGVLYGRWLARPVVALRDVAARIGRGDFSASIPPGAPTEVGALAQSMEDMRRNLFDLTDTLRQREAEAQAVLGGIVEGVYSVDSERRIRYANPQVARMLGRSESDIVGRFCGDVLNPKLVDGERPCVRLCPIIKARDTGHGSAAETLCLSDGSTRSTLIVSAPPVHGLQVQVVRDETELEAVRRARDSVLGNISHEFRTPLAAQLASIELLRDGLNRLPPEQQHELLGNVQRGVLRLMRLIDNLLESVRIEAGQLAIRQQSVDLQGVVEEAIELVAPLLAQRGLQQDVALPASERAVAGDAQRLTQVFVNLISNAAKYAPEHSTLRIGGRILDDEVEVWVEDEGAGLPEGDPAAIFQRFQRGGSSEPDAPGLGLGLWIVRSIVARHGGSVRAERVDNRTRFTITLPLEAVE